MRREGERKKRGRKERKSKLGIKGRERKGERELKIERGRKGDRK